MTNTCNLGILIFADIELLDFCGPYEVFSVANRFITETPFNVFTIAQHGGPVLSHNGLSVNSHHGLTDCPKPDVLLIPGGRGTRPLLQDAALIDWIKRTAASAKLVLSVCTGSLLLAKAGLLDGLETTTHHGSLDLLRELVPTATVHSDRRYLDNGRIICSAGISAGIDMSFHVVARLHGEEVTAKTARQMEYNWPPASPLVGYASA
jgi:transcriptional regulator GlxA family with amidase domain